MNKAIFLPNTIGGLMMLFPILAGATIRCDSNLFCDEVVHGTRSLQKSMTFEDRTSNGRKIRGGLIYGVGGVPKEFECTAKQCKYPAGSDPNGLFEDAKKRIVKVFLQGRAKSALKPEELNLIQRIENTAILSAETDRVCHNFCRSGEAARLMNSGVCVCPEVFAFPEESVLYAISHELGHAVDNCEILTPLKASSGQAIPALNYDSHPFHDGPYGVSACLKKNGIAVGNQTSRSQSEQLYRMGKFAGAHFAREREVPAPIDSMVLAPLAGAILKVTGSPFRDGGHVDCMGPMSGSQLQESLADWVGYQVAGDFLKDYPYDPKEKSGHLRPFAIMLEYGCLHRKRGSQEDNYGLIDHHATPSDRIDKIGLNVKSLRESLGCVPNPRTCEYEAPYHGPTGNVRGSSSTTR